MLKNPIISVVTINLNNLTGLKRTMNSLLEQNFKQFELIVIDGGSIDGSKEYIETQEDKINYWVSETDGGIYNAMNKGIKKAQGDYLYFLNSGDWLVDCETLEKIAPNLKGEDIVYGNIIKIFPDGREQLDKGINGKEITLKTFLEGTLYHPASFINKRLFMKYGFYDENLEIVSDWKFFLISLGLNNSFVLYLDRPVVKFDNTGVSNTDYTKVLKERSIVLNEIVPLPILKDYKKLKEYEKQINSKRFRHFEVTDSKGISRKLHSIIFRLFSDDYNS